nr:helix-turn-helix domain-containing protein [Cohnella terricola]
MRSNSRTRQTHFSIAEVAERVGFTNSSYFYRMFKKQYGLTPTDFRKSGHGGELADTAD